MLIPNADIVVQENITHLLHYGNKQGVRKDWNTLMCFKGSKLYVEFPWDKILWGPKSGLKFGLTYSH